MLTVEALQRLDLDTEHNRRMLADDRNRAGRYSHNLLFDGNNYKFRDYNAIHTTRTMHVSKSTVKPAIGHGEERALVPANFQWMLAKNVFGDYMLPHDRDYVFDKLLVSPTKISLQAELDHLVSLGTPRMTEEERTEKETAAKGASFEDHGHENAGMAGGLAVGHKRRLNIQTLTEEVAIIRQQLQVDDRMTELQDKLDLLTEYEGYCERDRRTLSNDDKARIKALKGKLSAKDFDTLLDESRGENLRAGIKWRHFKEEMTARDNAGQNWASRKRETLPTEILLEDTVGLRRPP